MKFKNYIETESGIKDTSTSPGAAGQVLSSTVTGTSWIDPDTLVSAASKLVVIACKNISGTPILKGTPVYQSGTVGATDVIEVEPADATISTGYLPAIGILQTTLNNNGFGNVVITGEFLNYSTADIPTDRPGGDPFTGDTVYLAVGGGLTCIKPTGAGNAIQNLGLVGKVSGGNAGSITVASIMRANDVPNLPEGRIWIGDGNTIVSDTVYVDEPNNRVGIGTTNPSTDLEVSSTGVNGVDISQSASNASQSGRLFFTTNTASEGFALFNSNGTFQVNSGGIPNNTSGTNRISIIGSSGNVGIGTTSPNEKLEVNGSVRVTGAGLDVGYGNNSNNFVQIGNGRTTNGFAFIDLVGDTTYSDYGLRLVRNNGGANTNSEIIHRGTGFLNLTATQAGGITLKTSNVERVRVNSSGNVGIGTTSLTTISSSSTTLSLGSTSATTSGGIAFQVSGGIVKAYNYVGTGYLYNQTVAGIGQIFFGAGSERMRIHNTTGNVGIGTTSPGSRLQVDGEIDANGGDGYRINGKPWANQELNILRLGDWDGEGFSTSIFDESSLETFKVKDGGVIINCDRTKATSYGSDASLVVGGSRFATYGPGVVTLLNNDPFSQAGDSTGLIQFAIKDDQTTAAGYTSASIKGSIDFAAGSGSSGGGILDFLTSAGALGGSPVTRMRINRLGNVGIGTTSPATKLHVFGTTGSVPGIGAAASAAQIGGSSYGTLFSTLTSGTGVIQQGRSDGALLTFPLLINPNGGNVGIGTTSPSSKLQVNGGVQLAFDGSTPSLAKVGTFRYRTSGNNSYVDMCMQTGASTYAWVNIVTNNW